MSFIDDIGRTMRDVSRVVSKGVQTSSDFIAQGVKGHNGPAMRDQLNDARQELKKIINNYQQKQRQIKLYEDPINVIGKYTSSLLHQSSDYVHGIAVNYSHILDEAIYYNVQIQRLATSNIVEPLIDLPIPGTIDGVPTALIPGVEEVKMVVGLINMVGDSFTLDEQLEKMDQNINKAYDYLNQANDTLGKLQQTGGYLIRLDNKLMDVFRSTCNVEMPRFSSDNPDQLSVAENALPDVIAHVTALKGNAFRTMRFIQNIISTRHIKEFTDEQRAFIVHILMQEDEQIANAFGEMSALRTFVDHFLNGTLLHAGLMQLPPVPDAIKDFLNEQQAEKQPYSDPQSSEFDPPVDLLQGFPPPTIKTAG